jgi:apolipoprotein N-acyltransferase
LTALPRTRLLPLLGLALASGLLLFASDYPLHLYPLQAIALLPLLLGLLRLCASTRAAALAGFGLGLGYTVPLAIALEFPPLMGGPLALYISAIWVLLAAGAFRVLRWPTPLGPIAVGAVAVVVEWIDFTAVPIWGTAQAFVRVWTAAAQTVQLASLAGVLGLVFALCAGQAILARLLLPLRPEADGRRRERLAGGLALALLSGGILAWSLYAWSRPTRGELTVAAIGWTAGDLERERLHWPPALFEKRYAPLVREAARRGAKLVVSPEVGFLLGAREKPILLERVASLARELGIALAVGYFDRVRDQNVARLVGPDGRTLGEYVKTHLIPFVERYRAGEGSLLEAELGGVRVGAMICQDDNFTDLARANGRRRAQLVVVPTNDWEQVKEYHLENARFRSVENGYATVRAASNGISAVISPRGEQLARRDHFREGPGVILARVPLSEGGRLYSWAGDWLAGASALVLLLGASWQRRRRRKEI